MRLYLEETYTQGVVSIEPTFKYQPDAYLLGCSHPNTPQLVGIYYTDFPVGDFFSIDHMKYTFEFYRNMIQFSLSAIIGIMKYVSSQ